MTRRFLRWLLPRLAVVAVFLAWGILVATCGRASETAASAPGRPVGAATAPETSYEASRGSARFLTALFPAGSSSSAAARPLTSNPVQEAGAEKAGGAVPAAPSAYLLAEPVPSPIYGSCDSPCEIVVGAPALKPLASDCRLPCYGVERRGPASWYNAGPGYYAAIPGYLGGVVSVVVCSFPEGRANCLTLPVVDSCQCYRHERRERVVDLSPAAFLEFASLSAGIVMVNVTVLR